jgi:hypothetical protein
MSERVRRGNQTGLVAVASVLLLGTSVAVAQGAGDSDGSDGPGKVELLEAGSQDRSKLRYGLSPGQSQKLRVTSSSSIKMSVAGMQGQQFEMPPIHWDVRLEPKSAKGGQYTVEAKVTKASLDDDGSTPAMIKRQLEGAVKALRGASGKVILDERGRVRSVDSSIAQAGSMGSRVRGQLEDLLRFLPVPLPEQAVGDGARWRITRTVERSGVEATHQVVYTLEQGKDGSRQVKATIEQTADEQTIQRPRGNVKLTRYKGEGALQGKLPLDRLGAQHEMTLRVETELQAGGRAMSNEMEATRRVEPK